MKGGQVGGPACAMTGGNDSFASRHGPTLLIHPPPIILHPPANQRALVCPRGFQTSILRMIYGGHEGGRELVGRQAARHPVAAGS